MSLFPPDIKGSGPVPGVSDVALPLTMMAVKMTMGPNVKTLGSESSLHLCYYCSYWCLWNFRR